jgi:hypothetical protein
LGRRAAQAFKAPAPIADTNIVPLRPLIILTLLLGALLAPAARADVEVGIADQKPEMFTDSRFKAMDLQHARLQVAWDALTSDWQTAEIDDWMAAAHRAGVQPLVTFGHSRLQGRRRALPSPSRFKYEFRRFRARYPWVKDYATWNEANHCGEPTCHRIALVVNYYRSLRRECPTCRILASEVLDMPNMVAWVKEFRRLAGTEPRYWGLHNYIDTNRFRTTSTQALIKATKGEIWLTEVGGIVERTNRVKVGFPESPAHAADAMRWLFDRIVPLSSRIHRVYLYHWSQGAPGETWDSALINRHGKSRPALNVVRARILDGIVVAKARRR